MFATLLAGVAFAGLSGCAAEAAQPIHPQEESLRAGNTPVLTGEYVGFDGWYLEYQSALAKWELPPGTHIPAIAPWVPEIDPVTGKEMYRAIGVGGGWVDGDSAAYCLWLGEWLTTRQSDPQRAAKAVAMLPTYFETWGFTNLVDAAPGFFESLSNEILLDAPKLVDEYYRHNCGDVHNQYPDVAERSEP